MTDRLASARSLSLAALVVAVLGLGLPIADALLRSGSTVGPAPSLVEALRLTGPALHPAGTPARQPETLPPGADLHSTPGLVAFPLDDADLLLGTAVPAGPPPDGSR